MSMAFVITVIVHLICIFLRQKQNYTKKRMTESVEYDIINYNRNGGEFEWSRLMKNSQAYIVLVVL